MRKTATYLANDIDFAGVLTSTPSILRTLVQPPIVGGILPFPNASQPQSNLINWVLGNSTYDGTTARKSE